MINVPLTATGSSYTAAVSVGGVKRSLLVDTTSSNVLVPCVDDAKCPQACAPRKLWYAIPRSEEAICATPTPTTVEIDSFRAAPGFRVGVVGANAVADKKWRLLNGTDGVLGLGPASRGVYDPMLRMDVPANESVLTSQLQSYSLWLGSSPPALVLNGDHADASSFQAVELPLRASRYSFEFKGKAVLLGGETMIDYISKDFTVDPTIDTVSIPSEATEKIWQTLGKLPSCLVKPTVLITDRRCDADAKLPPLGLVFGTHTFILQKEDYTKPHPKFPSQLTLKIDTDASNLRLGLPFLRKFGVKIAVDGNDVTLYCKQGATCSFGAQSMPESSSSSSSPSPSADNGSTSSSSSSTSTGTIIGIIVAIVVFALFALFIIRKRRLAKRSIEEQAADAAFAGAETPQKKKSIS
ncbi:hypothetical protein ATCC90586_010873 [Pythium insidiosum]|nr:hypothetical protein ATCC90586_010873 [Pythium insidiosum]